MANIRKLNLSRDQLASFLTDQQQVKQFEALIDNINALGGQALTVVDDTNVTITLGGLPQKALIDAVSLTLGWSGVLSESRGGTGEGTFTDGQLLIGNSAGGLTKSTLTAGSGIVIASANGQITISTSAVAGLSGTATTASYGGTGFVPGTITFIDGKVTAINTPVVPLAQQVSIGFETPQAITGGVAVGYMACKNTTAGGNVGVGNMALLNNVIGGLNVAIGSEALRDNGGSSNIAVGSQSLLLNQSGGSNVAIGNQASMFSNAGSRNVAIGSESQVNTTFGPSLSHSDNVSIGAGSLSIFSSDRNIAIGTRALEQTPFAEPEKIAIGYEAMKFGNPGQYSIGIGADAFNNTAGAGRLMIQTKDANGVYCPVQGFTSLNNSISLGTTSTTDAFIQVAWTVVSDVRDKIVFNAVPHGLEFVKKLTPIKYQYKMYRGDSVGHGPLRYGFSAQEVLEAEGETPIIVNDSDPEKLRFNDQSLLAVLVNAIKEQQVIIESMQARLLAAGF